MKGIPIRRNRKTVIFSLPRGLWSSPYMSLFLSLHLTAAWPSHPTPTPSILACCVICGSCGSLFYVRWLASPGLHFAVASERTAHKLHCLLSLLLAVTYRVSVCWPLSFYTSLLLSCCFSLGFSLQLRFSCVCATVISRSPGTEQFMVNTVPGQSDVLLLLKKTRHLVSTVTDLHSVLL